jgi:hypothetical protein
LDDGSNSNSSRPAKWISETIDDAPEDQDIGDWS